VPVLSPRGHDPDAPNAHSLAIAEVPPPRLKSPDEPLYLAVAHFYRIVEEPGPRGPWRVKTAGYSYIIHGAEGRELYAFQWQPHGPSPVTTPHLHLGSGLGTGNPQLPKKHIPTGRISLEEVIRMAIRELGVEPLRDDWEEVLAESEEAFTRWRTWA
jgi:hypothetical protein